MTDDQGLIELLSYNLDYFRAKPVNPREDYHPAHHGYHPEKITTVLQAVYPQRMTKISFELAPKLTKAEKTAQGKAGERSASNSVGEANGQMLGWRDVKA